MAEIFHVHPGERENSAVLCRNDGYAYHINRVIRHVDGTTLYLRCSRYRSLQCTGTFTLKLCESQQQVLGGQVHVYNCAPDHMQHQVRLLRTAILEASEFNDYESPKQTVNRLAQNFPPPVAARVLHSSIRTSIRRKRLLSATNIPHTFDELRDVLSSPDFSHLIATVDESDTIYSATVGPPGHQSVVFVSGRMLRFLKETKIAFADATFVPTPAQPRASQVYQIVTVVRGSHVVPVVQAIMEAKSFTAYYAILQHLKRIAPRFRPLRVVTDFEKAEQQAWMVAYGCKVVGCYVHYLRSFIKHVGALRLRKLMQPRSMITRIIRSMYSIPLLPKDMMRIGFNVVTRMADKFGVANTRLDQLFRYYEKTWLRGLYMKNLSVYKEKHRTNNACESANRILRTETGPHHPNICAFLSALRRYEQNAYVDVCAWRDGLPFGRTRRAAVLKNDTCIKYLTAELLGGNISVRRFLWRASNTVKNLVDESL